jgi:hypothetical protein
VKTFVVGDVNNDQLIDVGDAIHLLNFLFKQGPPPHLIVAADCNCDNIIDLGDVVLILNYLFKQGQVPGDC